jgi:hypothetical protein
VRRLLAPALVAGLSAAGAAQESALAPAPVVISPAAESLAVTIYADDLALVRETRTLELPEGFSIVEFRGVSDAIVPHAAIVEGLHGIVERNFDYDVLTPYALVENAVGGEVTLVRTNPGSGATTRERARVVSGGEGVVLDFGDGRIEAVECSGLPEGLAFDALPAGLRSEPTLSARVHNERAGKQELTLVYLAHGISWSADYVLSVAPEGDRFDLEAWLTLGNEGGTTFRDAAVAVVAGELNRGDDGGVESALAVLEDHCWSWGRRWPGFWRPHGIEGLVPFQETPMGIAAFSEEVEEIIVTARKRIEQVTEAQREELLDYHLYRVPWATTVAAQQSKQVRFLAKRGVRFERFYSFGDAYGEFEASSDGSEPADSVIRFFNRAAEGLGEPLPSGTIRAFQTIESAGPQWVGEHEIGNTAVDLPVELALGEAAGMRNRVTIVERRERPRLLAALRGRSEVVIHARVEHELTNAGSTPAPIELRQFGEGLRISEASHPWQKERGYPVWRVEVPANGSVTLRYRVKMTVTD